MTNFLVTGGAGFIGSNLAEALVEQGHAVRIIDNFSTGRRENLAGLLDRVELIEGDITHPEDVSRAVQDIEVVLHLAAIPSVPRSVEDPLSTNEASVTATLNILLAAHRTRVRRVVFASSSSIYGDQAPDLPKVETMTPNPISPYGVAKLAAEKYCQVFYQVYGLETVALRYFNVFGPRQNPDSAYAAVIPRFINALLTGQPPIIYGDGEQTRDFTYVGNVIHGNLLAASAPPEKVAGQVFNLAAGGQTSLNSLVKMLHEITGRAVPPLYEPPRTGDIKHSRASIEKAQQLMGYEPIVSLHEGLTRTVRWYAEQRGYDI
ncbi:MAG: SDR family oxidoreductase [Anaerolineae bacterium]